MSDIHEKLANVQDELEVPKSRRNDFGDFNYRSCEDILQKAKPILKDHDLVLTISDDVVLQGDRYYIRAMAKITDIESDEDYATTAYAREAKNKKGMDPSQLSGATSSYARKYALDGLFALDDSRDPDAMKTEKKQKKSQSKSKKSHDNNQDEDDTPPADVEAIKKEIEEKKDAWAGSDDPATKKQAEAFASFWSDNVGTGDEDRIEFLELVTERELESSKDLYKAEISPILEQAYNNTEEFVKLAKNYNEEIPF